jgi:hypothetical protein
VELGFVREVGATIVEERVVVLFLPFPILVIVLEGIECERVIVLKQNSCREREGFVVLEN